MSIGALIRPWSGEAWRQIPADSPYDVLDFRFAGSGTDNRWSYPGEPTLYLAQDEATGLNEFSRNLETRRAPSLRSAAVARQFYYLELQIERALDLRASEVLDELSLADAPNCFKDKSFARATAHYLRITTPAQAILVPPIGLLDRPESWNLVLFLEKLPEDPTSFVTSVTRGRVFRLEP